MNDKDPPPFGYTFTTDYFETAAPADDHNGQSILSDTENQHLDNFFTNTNPFDLPDSQPFLSAIDTKAGAHDYNNWEDFISPATVHRVTTTIPDQVQLQHNFHHDPHYNSSLHTDFFSNTQDELQAATALFNQAQPSYTNGRSHSFQASSATNSSFSANDASGSNHNALAMGIAPRGLLNERMGTLMPNQSGQSTLNAQFAGQWATGNTPQQQHADFGPPLQKLDLKRSYTFGTDNSFNSPAGYAAPNGHESERRITQHSLDEMQDAGQHLLRAVAGIDAQDATSTGYTQPLSAATTVQDNADDPSDEEAISDEEQDDPSTKKRRKSQYRITKENLKKRARNAKTRKVSVVEETSKKKRASTAMQKAQRENLTEEQKRNNHILSEQKRRDLIKQGYKDLNEVVPAVRGGGLSKSQVLVEAANFLDKLMEENETFRQLIG